MLPRERGRTPSGLRTQLLHHLRNEALRTGIPVQRLHQRIAFERFLARLPADGTWILKGGFALELRYGLETRSTRDMDLRTLLNPLDALEGMRRTISTSQHGDNFDFEFGAIVQEMQGAPGGSLRVRVVALLAGQELVTFHIDLSSGDAMVGSPDILRGSDLLEFTGIVPVEFPVYPVVQHLAEKLHAYTLPRTQENTRVRDLADLVIFAANESIEAGRLGASVNATFEIRRTHSIPDQLPDPPDSWEQPFAAIAAEAVNLPATNLADGFALALRFWAPFLFSPLLDWVWLPDQLRWSAPPALGQGI